MSDRGTLAGKASVHTCAATNACGMTAAGIQSPRLQRVSEWNAKLASDSARSKRVAPLVMQPRRRVSVSPIFPLLWRPLRMHSAIDFEASQHRLKRLRLQARRIWGHKRLGEASSGARKDEECCQSRKWRVVFVIRFPEAEDATRPTV